jgi:hypothetical protein
VNGLIKVGLGLAGVPDTLVADIERQVPGGGRLVVAAKQVQPDVLKLEALWEQMSPHVAALLPLIEQALPIVNRVLPVIKAESPDLALVMPVAQRVLAFVDGQKTA